MAQITYRANLSAKSFPLISDNWGRSVIVPQYDNAFSRQLASAEDTDKDVGIPQVFYMHNVMPTPQGFQSVGYTTVIAAHASVVTFTSVWILRDSSDTKALLGVTAAGDFYVNTGSAWVFKFTAPVNNQVTVAYVSGITYIYVGLSGCYSYNFGTALFSSVTLGGLDATKVVGITSSVGYLLAWTVPINSVARTLTTTTGSGILTGAVTTGVVINQSVSGTGIPLGAKVVSIAAGVSITIDQLATANGTVAINFAAIAAGVAWSSTIDSTDFVPSLVTGAGGGNIEGARGAITYLVAHTLGFIAYTTNNAVSAVYSNNARYPFTFREIISSGGLSSLDLVAYDANTGNHYAYTTSGLQIVSTSQTQTIIPELTDFISGKYFEDYDEVTGIFTRTLLTATMAKKVNVIADRYLVVSYGITGLTHALIFDLSLKRWGKIRIPHVSTIEYLLLTPGAFEIPKQSIGFMQANGTIKVIDFGAYAANSLGVIALGKYQFIRSRLLQLDTISVENIYDQAATSLTILSSLDGKNAVASVPTSLYTSGTLAVYGARAQGINHALILKGNFLLESLVLVFNVGAKR